MSHGKATGLDLKNAGIAESELPGDQIIVGHVDGEGVLLTRCEGQVCAIGASCTHYGGPLAEGLRVGDTIRCPWHHARFSLRTGEALAAPALTAATCWQVEHRDGRIFVREKALSTPVPKTADRGGRMLIVGGGAAGYAAAEMMRRLGHDGPITVLSADRAAPYDRPNLSKDYLAGSASEAWMPLRPNEFYTRQSRSSRTALLHQN